MWGVMIMWWVFFVIVVLVELVVKLYIWGFEKAYVVRMASTAPPSCFQSPILQYCNHALLYQVYLLNFITQYFLK